MALRPDGKLVVAGSSSKYFALARISADGTIDGFELQCWFCTLSSVSFRIGKGIVRGWVDVHFPCAGHIKAHISGALREEDLEYDRTRKLVAGVMEQLKIPPDETYEALSSRLAGRCRFRSRRFG